MPNVKLREDLKGFCVPAYDSIEAPDTGMGSTMLCAKELDGAKQLPDLCEDTEPEYCFNRIKLKDGRIFFMHGIDLDWI